MKFTIDYLLFTIGVEILHFVQNDYLNRFLRPFDYFDVAQYKCAQGRLFGDGVKALTG